MHPFVFIRKPGFRALSFDTCLGSDDTKNPIQCFPQFSKSIDMNQKKKKKTDRKEMERKGSRISPQKHILAKWVVSR